MSHAENLAEQDTRPIWIRASLQDVAEVDLDKPIAGSTAAECRELTEAFHEAAKLDVQSDVETSANRVYSMLGTIAGMYERFSNRHQPFGPMYQDHERRSPAPQDFRGAPVVALSAAALRITHPALRARVADVCWLLERRRAEMGRLAVISYIQSIEMIIDETLTLRFEKESQATSRHVQTLLRRALSIAKALSPDLTSDEASHATELVARLRNDASVAHSPIRLHWFAELDLAFSISPSAEIAKQLEARFERQPKPDDFDALELWRLAARAYHKAKQPDDAIRCQRAAVETLVHMSEAAMRDQNSAMAAASWLADAISELHGLPDAKEQRRKLRHKLVDLQSAIPDEMGTFEHSIDLDGISRAIRERLSGASLLDMFLLFALCESPPAPEKLKEDAEKSIAEHPLSSLFSSTYHDAEGKAVHRVDGGFEGDELQNSIRATISQHEAIRREIHAFGQVEAARQYIKENYFVGEDTFVRLLAFSPFVPSNLVRTFAVGFSRFFEADYVSALYVLTPLLENSLRHILKLHGHDVSIFDDSTQLQQDRTISSLFEQMRNELDSIFGVALAGDMERVFLSRPGPTLRHHVAHGLLNDGSPFGGDAIYACWLIFHLCCKPIWRQRERISLD